MSEPKIEHHYADVGGLLMHYVTAGAGEPLVLLHGWPQTWYEWRQVIPALARRFRVIAPDLRGLGDTGRPADGYDKRTVAEDVYRLVHDHLGCTQICLAGHDWGGPVAFALTAAHRDTVRRLALLDVTVPGDGAENLSQGGRRWHHGFHRTADLPEALVQGRERIYLSWFYRTFSHRPDAIPEAAVAEYLRTYTQPGALRAGFAYYRAIPEDIAHNRAMLERDGKLQMPVLGLGGDRSWGRRMEVVESLKLVANDVRGGEVPECGHFVPEERPDLTIERLVAFFGEGGG